MLSCGFVAGAMAASLTASTSLTVVNVTSFRGADITRWGGAWPNSPDTLKPQEQEAYINKVDFYPTTIEWYLKSASGVGVAPYPPFANGVSSLLCAVWSEDNGKTFQLKSWDYLAPATHVKRMENGMPNCWMGTIVHSVCDRSGGECNGRNRTNLYFEEYPSGSTNCWGSAVMK